MAISFLVLELAIPSVPVIFNLECKDSCTSCGGVCFKYTDVVTQEGAMCKVNSIGYYISLSGTNIKIDFAHPLESALNIASLNAKSDKGIVIDTSLWTLNTCAVGSTGCTIATSLTTDQLPIQFDFQFSQV
ncbi:unnamed protein product [Blepharisma stoltei]|uniref:Uncharacterized protein n=1 Tax=Blepharisma stoltei TaxID=1481888 RepID=A0AAU9KPB6_9CILI|nr:unnamed protein product [Blepharisma stoltei]